MFKKFLNYLNNEKNSFNKLIPFFILLLFIILNLTIMVNIYSNEQKNSDILRLHVVANSNSIEDQIIKLKVNEKLINYIDNLSNSENISINNIKDNIEEILTISNNTLEENNINYSASLNLGKINYEKKDSILLSMDKGRYDSIQVVLGNGKGKNIWTLISPSKENINKIQELNTILPGLDTLYNNQEFSTENNKKVNIEYGFKILEVFNNLKNLI